MTQSCLTFCDPVDCRTPGFSVRHQCLEFTQTYVHWVGDAIQASHLLLLLPSIFPNVRVFSSESALHIRWPKHSSFGFSIGPSNEYSRLISFMIDWFDLLAVQGTLKRLLQHSSTLSPLYGPTLSSLKDCWKYHSFDQREGSSLAKCCLCLLIRFLGIS